MGPVTGEWFAVAAGEGTDLEAAVAQDGDDGEENDRS